MGLIFFGMGVSLCLRSGFGNNPLGVFVTGVALTTSLSVGTCNMLNGLFQTFVGIALERKNVTIGTFIIVFFGSYSIDVANMIFPVTDVMTIRIIYMVAGICSYCLGFSLQQYARCGLGNYDCFIFGLAKALHISDYSKIRWITDGLYIIGGYLLGGTVGLATVILVFFSGKLVVFFKKQLIKTFGE